MQVKVDRLKRKIEKIEEKLDSTKRIFNMLNPAVFGEEVTDIMRCERQYERLQNRLNGYQTRYLELQNAN